MLSLASPLAHAADQNSGGNGGTPSGGDRTNKPEEDDYQETPYTEYGSFNEEKDEEDETKFFQYGRFFGVSLGLGVETIDGDRGTLYQGGFPTFDGKIHYWFDFNFALDLDFYLAQHYFIGQPTTALSGRYNVSIMHLGVDFKYYFDTKNLAAAISFANPYLLVGGGDLYEEHCRGPRPIHRHGYRHAGGIRRGRGTGVRTETSQTLFHHRSANQRRELQRCEYPDFANQGLPDLHGNFYTFIASLLFTW